MSLLRFFGLYLVFDLQKYTLARVLGFLGLPVLLLVLLVPAAISLGRIETLFATPVWVVGAEDQEASLREVVRPPLFDLSVHAELPPTAGGPFVGIVVELDASPDAVQPVRVHGADPQLVAMAEERLLGWMEAQWVDERLGQPADLVVVGSDGQPLRRSEAPVELELPDPGKMLEAYDPSGIRAAVGYGVIALFGLVLGLPVGRDLARNGRGGFVHLLGLGVAHWKLYLAEMASNAVQIGLQSASFWLVYGGGLVVAAVAGLVELPSGRELVLDGVVLAVLAVATLVQTTTLGCLMEQLSRDLPTQVRENGPSVLIVAVLVLSQVVEALLTETVIRGMAVSPLFGPMALWSRHLEGDPLVWPLLGLQGLFVAGAIWIGSQVFMLEESPGEWRRRRNRRYIAVGD